MGSLPELLSCNGQLVRIHGCTAVDVQTRGGAFSGGIAAMFWDDGIERWMEDTVKNTRIGVASSVLEVGDKMGKTGWALLGNKGLYTL